MSDVNVTADLQVDDGATKRLLSVEDFKATRTGAATEATLAALRDLFTAEDFATDASLDALLAKLEAVRALLAGTLRVDALSLPLPTGAASEVTLDDLRDRIGSYGVGVPEEGTVTALLRQVRDNIAALELTSDAISLNADAINLNTDTVESILNAIGGAIGTTSDPATLDTAIGRLKAILAAVDGVEALLASLGGKDYATEAKLEQVRALLAGTLAVGGTVTVANPTANPETGLAKDATLQAVRDRLPSTLDGGAMPVADVFTGGESLPDQGGTGGVLTFNFAAPVDLVWVRSVGGVSRADPFGGTPTSTTGVYCADDEPTPITVRAQQVKVYAPIGATVSVWGFRG